MRGGYKLNRTEYLTQKSIEARFRQTDKFQARNGFGIYVCVLAIVLLVIFG
jgi:hypothetical protein